MRLAERSRHLDAVCLFVSHEADLWVAGAFTVHNHSLSSFCDYDPRFKPGLG